MPKMSVNRLIRSTDMAFWLFVAFIIALGIVGGASRADVFSQVAIRTCAVLLLAIWALIGSFRSVMPARAVGVLIVACCALPLLQLLPLPPAIWTNLPGRSTFADLANIIGSEQPWRPLSISPDATWNSLASLIVPAAGFLIIRSIRADHIASTPAPVLALVLASALVGLLQVVGAAISNPWMNDRIGAASGLFANRNHQALMLAIGIPLAAQWALSDHRARGWRVPASAGLVLFFILMVFATGSRAGLLLLPVALGGAVVLTYRDLTAMFSHMPRWLRPTIIGLFVALLVVLVAMSFEADRAQSFYRLIEADPGQDMRARALPTVLQMTGAYFPAGIGYGTFDPAFRISEPFALLQYTYFNHAHNDLLEVVLEGGLPGATVLLAGIAWWLAASTRAWRKKRTEGIAHARLGSIVILLILIASAFDYPARTPTMMFMLTIAGIWLSRVPGDTPAGKHALRP